MNKMLIWLGALVSVMISASAIGGSVGGPSFTMYGTSTTPGDTAFQLTPKGTIGYPDGVSSVTITGTTNFASADISNVYGPCLKAAVNITSLTGTTPTITVQIQGKDTISGLYFTVLSSAALSTTGLTVLTVCPGITVTANVSASDIVPGTVRANFVYGGTVTASAGTVGLEFMR